ncbi:hypothetical protein [Commensalibacter nepenthis]|uniref:Entry exclusion protein 1 n=1 Tax=Commensalibacter nepenthis TaxID=3043872 RepID=A0ABT6QC53_9PROT|nr:hypothetical protein [Commensalibacter sp. TBRC 10068]MDI2113925.1 hypothetical protein [Commensalibacter sp. TBRC 10068]
MSIVSITQASKLTGKSVRTIQRHLSNGKLSFVMTQNDNKGIDTSELIRVYGHIMSGIDITSMSRHVINDKTPNDVTNTPKEKPLEHQIDLLKLELEAEKRLSNERLQTIDSLKTALKLLEHRQETTQPIEPPKEDNISEPQKNDGSVDDTSNTGLLGRFKKLFR